MGETERRIAERHLKGTKMGKDAKSGLRNWRLMLVITIKIVAVVVKVKHTK